MRAPSDLDLINTAAKYFYYKSRGSTNDPDHLLEQTLKKELDILKDKINLAEIEEETYDEMYLNAKKNPVTYGLFSKVGLQTTQDWVLGYFLFSYVIISIFIILTALKVSVNKIWTGIAVSGVMLAIGLVFFLMILYLG